MKHLSDNNFNTNKLQNVPNPASPGDAVNKAYADTKSTASVVNIKDYGAIGNGTTNDTSAIQAAINDANGRVVLFPPGTYYITSSLNVPADTVGGLIAEGSWIKKGSGSYPAIDIVGSLITSASPVGAGNQALARTEMKWPIHGLRIYSDNYTGTGIRLSGMFGIDIDSCHIFGVHTGIHFTGRHRNGNVRATNIWDCSTFGVRSDSTVNMHQFIFTGCHISYAQIGVSFEDGEIHNILFDGCSIETASTGQLTPISCVSITKSTSAGNYEKITFTGCQIEDHSAATDAVVRLVNTHQVSGAEDFALFNGFVFSGCTIGNGAEGGIRLHGTGDVVISGCGFLGCHGRAIRTTGRIEGLTIDGNIISVRSTSSVRQLGFLHMKSDQMMGNINITGNTVRGGQGQLLRIERDTVTGINLYEFNMTGNIFHMQSATPSGFDTAERLVHIGSGNSDTISGAIITGNIIRSRAYVTADALRLSGTYSKTSIIGNVIRDGTSTLPAASSGNIIVSNNM